MSTTSSWPATRCIRYSWWTTNFRSRVGVFRQAAQSHMFRSISRMRSHRMVEENKEPDKWKLVVDGEVSPWLKPLEPLVRAQLRTALRDSLEAFAEYVERP